MRRRVVTAWRSYRALDRRVWILAAIRAVNTMGLSLVMAFMAVYLVTDRGQPASLYGIVYLVANLCQSLSQGVAGELSDRIGRVRLMAGTLAVRALVIAALGLTVLTEAPILVIAAVIVLSSSLRGGFEPVAYAVVADVARPGERVAAYGLQRMGTNLGWAIGPATGGALAAVVPFGAVFFCAAPILLLASIAAARVREPARTSAAPPEDAFAAPHRRPPGLALFLGCALLFAVCHVQLFSTMALFATGPLVLDKAEVGLLFAVNGALVLLLQLPAVGLIDRLGAHRALPVGAALYLAAFAAFGAAGDLTGLALGVAVFTAGEVLLAPAQQALNADYGDPRRMGRAFGIFGTVQMLGVALAPVLGGAAFDAFAPSGPALWGTLAALPALMTAGYAALAWQRRRGHVDDTDRAH